MLCTYDYLMPEMHVCVNIIVCADEVLKRLELLFNYLIILYLSCFRFKKKKKNPAEIIIRYNSQPRKALDR